MSAGMRTWIAVRGGRWRSVLALSTPSSGSWRSPSHGVIRRSTRSRAEVRRVDEANSIVASPSVESTSA